MYGYIRFVSIAVLFSLFIMPANAGGYVVERGDVLEVNIAGAPGLHRKAPVEASGQFSMPLVGDIDAAGIPLSELRTKLRDLLIQKNIVRNPDVTIDVAEYRPVYVAGDVVKPGAYPYRPGMTVRDSVALAEGYDLFHLRGRDPMLESVDARGELQAAAVELAKQTARVARIKAELAGRGDMNLAALKALALQPDIVAEVMQIESQQLIADREDAEREKASLARTIKTTQEQIAALKQEENSAAAALEEQTRGLNRARDLMQRGLLQTIRLEDSQRAEAAAKNLLYEVQSRAAQARRDLEDAMRKLQVADDQRRIRMLEDLRDTVSLVATAQARLEAATEKVRFTGAAQSGRSADEQMDPPKVVIHRVQDGVLQPIKGDEATVLIPGDNLQITTKLEFNKLLGLTRTAAPK